MCPPDVAAACVSGQDLRDPLPPPAPSPRSRRLSKLIYDRVMLDAPSPDVAEILVVDDEEPLVRLVGDYLRKEGFTVTAIEDGVEAVRRARELRPAVVVLDLGLPSMDGVEVCRQIRTFSDCYILMLTARAEEIDRLVGLSVGADDYVTKPFSPRELVLRVKALLRRPRHSVTSGAREYRVGSLIVDVAGREVCLEGDSIDLTPTEFDVLVTLISDPGTAFSRSVLITRVWGEDWVGDTHLVDVHVGHLRRKLGDSAGDPRFIRTVRGVGYKMGTGQ